jgi:hypothetical protein
MDGDYLNFDLLFSRAGDGPYTARILYSPGGEAQSTFSLPFDETALDALLARLRIPRGDASDVEAGRSFGRDLFDAVFDARMFGCLRASLVEAEAQNTGLRLRLRFDDSAASLGRLPWELLYDAALEHFVALSTRTPVVRYLELPEAGDPLAVGPPLTVLVVIADPGDLAPLDVEHEWSVITEALRPLDEAGRVRVVRLDTATLPALQDKLRDVDVNVLHFIGHGEFDAETGGALYFEGEGDKSQPVPGKKLGVLLHDHRSLRLAVLNTCEGGAAAEVNQFAGVAQRLVQEGMPAVVAMQFKVTDRAAIALARTFYGTLADGYPVDAALAEARKAVYLGGTTVEWATPVLYMRAPQGRLFEGEPAGDADAPSAPDAPPRLHLEGVHVAGDLVSGDKVIGGDEVHGDKITVGDISGSVVAIGSGASVHADRVTVVHPFDQTRAALREMPLPPAAKEQAGQALDRVEQEARREKPDVDQLDRWLDVLESVAPDAVEVLINALLNPGAAVGGAVRVAVKTWRRARGG